MIATERIPFVCLDRQCGPDCLNPVCRTWNIGSLYCLKTGRLSDPYPQGTRHCCTNCLGLDDESGSQFAGGIHLVIALLIRIRLARFCLNIPEFSESRGEGVLRTLEVPFFKSVACCPHHLKYLFGNSGPGLRTLLLLYAPFIGRPLLVLQQQGIARGLHGRQ